MNTAQSAIAQACALAYPPVVIPDDSLEQAASAAEAFRLFAPFFSSSLSNIRKSDAGKLFVNRDPVPRLVEYHS